MKYFVVSDVHSCYDELMIALKSNNFDMTNPHHKLVVCGDLFDRGSQSIEVFEFVKELQAQDRLIYVKGNHEELLGECVNEFCCGKVPGEHHIYNGTTNTIIQFCNNKKLYIGNKASIKTVKERMRPILQFIDDNCVDYFEIGNYIFVHGWIPLDVDYKNADSDYWSEARWTNGMEMWWLNPESRLPNKTIVCGHVFSNWGHNKIHKVGKIMDCPFVDDGIIAIDGRVVESRHINCIVIED